jgi:hypothetical protein
MASIFEYMKETPPEIASGANSLNGRNAIRREAKEYGKFLKSVKETAEKMADKDTIKEIDKDISFWCKWMVKFGICDEKEEC